MPQKYSHDMHVSSVIVNINGVYYYGFDMSKLYERFRQPTFFFWPIIS